ncbi:MAG: succinyl-diaminopimelate desuccinylase [Pseudomonadota bacterium]
MKIDPVKLTQQLIACPSVTPKEGGALTLLEGVLKNLGFLCHRLPFGEGSDRVDNLYARWGREKPNLCFAGHTDVVPSGDKSGWKYPPFSATIDQGILYGRGAVDMKTAIVCFIAAFSETAQEIPGSISLLITGDEEGLGTHGTIKVMEWLQAKGEILDACLVGEPTSQNTVGDMLKIGRRGSLTGCITVKGTQGHVAYPHLADNPIPKLLAFLSAINEKVLDTGTADFSASNLEITSVDVGNSTTNVIPSQVTACFSIRFNTEQSGAKLTHWLQQMATVHARDFDLEIRVSGEPFLVEHTSRIAQCTATAIKTVTGKDPEFSTSGGTSDARFIHKLCPVVECGLLNKTAHHVDERVPLADIETLMRIYVEVLRRYFA